MISLQTVPGGFRVVFDADGVELFRSTCPQAARERAAALWCLAQRRGARTTSDELRVLFPASAPAPLAFEACGGAASGSGTCGLVDPVELQAAAQGYSDLGAAERSALVVRVGEAYLAAGAGADFAATLAAYERARRDLEAGAVRLA
jgi:hypothetical protein